MIKILSTICVLIILSAAAFISSRNQKTQLSDLSEELSTQVDTVTVSDSVTSEFVRPNSEVKQWNNLEKDTVVAQTFWVKVCFSAIFCGAALFIILSQRYNAETQKWAFSVLTLIAGVWIGSIA